MSTIERIHSLDLAQRAASIVQPYCRVTWIHDVHKFGVQTETIRFMTPGAEFIAQGDRYLAYRSDRQGD